MAVIRQFLEIHILLRVKTVGRKGVQRLGQLWILRFDGKYIAAEQTFIALALHGLAAGEIALGGGIMHPFDHQATFPIPQKKRNL